MQTMKKLFLILSVAAGLVSCEDFLTAGDPNKIDAPSYCLLYTSPSPRDTR